MQIDDYAAARLLTEKISANLPIQAYPSKAMVKMLQTQGKRINSKNPFNIELASYSGDAGGIMCTLNGEEKEAFIVSITHLKIDPNHPLAPEIEAYQKMRSLKLAIKDSGGFVAEMLKQGSVKTKWKSSKKGFGRS